MSDKKLIETIEIMGIMNEENRMKVLSYLESIYPSGESLKRISDECSMKPTLLVYHLKILQKSGLVKKGSLIEEGRRDHTRYNLTEDGRDLWSSADLLDIGKVKQGMNDNRKIGCPDKISFIPMEFGPRSFRIREV